MKKILVVGSINMDLVISTSRLPVLGETIVGDGFETIPGGKGANQAVACAKLGGNVLFHGAVGNDAYANVLTKALTDVNIDISNVVTTDTNSGVAVITVCDGNNHIILDGGANQAFTPDKINADIFKDINILILQFEIPTESVLFAAKTAKTNGATVILNPAPIKEFDAQLLKYVDIIIPNESEAELLTGKKIDSVEHAKEALPELLNSGVKTAIITLGSNGCLYNDGEDLIHVPAKKITPVDTTAAGDTFIGALSVCLSDGLSLDESIKFAVKASALTCTRKGASISIPSKQEVLDFNC